MYWLSVSSRSAALAKRDRLTRSLMRPLKHSDALNSRLACGADADHEASDTPLSQCAALAVALAPVGVLPALTLVVRDLIEPFVGLTGVLVGVAWLVLKMHAYQRAIGRVEQQQQQEEAACSAFFRRLSGARNILGPAEPSRCIACPERRVDWQCRPAAALRIASAPMLLSANSCNRKTRMRRVISCAIHADAGLPVGLCRGGLP